MSDLLRVADRIINRPLLITPQKLAAIASGLQGRLGFDLSTGSAHSEMEMSHRAGARVFDAATGRVKPYGQTSDGIAVIEIMGTLVNRGSYLNASSGIASYDSIRHALISAGNDQTVRAIVLDIDSAGGEAIGAFETADVVHDVAKSKSVIAVVNGMAASAAYAIASAASKIVTTQSSVLGSIGVVLLHFDHGHRLNREGITPTLIHAGARKVDGNPYQPLTDDVKAELKSEVDTFFRLFVDTVAKGRQSLTKKSIKAQEARTFIGAEAVKVGLADAVGSFEATIAVLGRTSLSRSISRDPANLLQAAISSEDTRSAEIDRVSNILAEGHRKGLLAAAETLARMPTSVISTEAALSLLRFSPEPQIGMRTKDAPLGLVISKPAGQVNADNWSDVIARLNKEART